MHCIPDTYSIQIHARFTSDTPDNVSERFSVFDQPIRLRIHVGFSVSDMCFSIIQTCLSIIRNLHIVPHGSSHRRSYKIINKIQLKWKMTCENRTWSSRLLANSPTNAPQLPLCFYKVCLYIS
jgi:hypothetical protein